MSAFTFTSTSALIDWMQEEYLSELLLGAMKPKPRAKPPNGDVRFEWGLAGVEDNALHTYLVRASGVKCWSLEGDWGKDTPVSLAPEAVAAAPVVLHQEVPGLLALECAEVTVERGPVKRYRPPPRPDPERFLVRGPREVRWREILFWLNVPADVLLFEQMPGERGNRRLDETEIDAIIKSPRYAMYRLQKDAADEQPWQWANGSLAITTVGHSVSFSRGTLDDAAWRHVRQIPIMLGECTVDSGTIRCSGEQRLARFAS